MTPGPELVSSSAPGAPICGQTARRAGFPQTVDGRGAIEDSISQDATASAGGDFHSSPDPDLELIRLVLVARHASRLHLRLALANARELELESASALAMIRRALAPHLPPIVNGGLP